MRDGDEGMQVSQNREVRWEELMKERRKEGEQEAWRVVWTMDSIAEVRERCRRGGGGEEEKVDQKVWNERGRS